VTDAPRTLFVGRGNGGVCWYRCALPAMQLGYDWIGIDGEPPNIRILAGATSREHSYDQWADYDVIVLQYQASTPWVHAVRELQASGTKVLFEIDDYARSIRKKGDHPMADRFGPEFIASFELCMSVCDGVICSTEWLAGRYRSINPRAWVCPNAIDLPRYAFQRVPRDGVTIGWAGGTGHAIAMEPWLEAVEAVMAAHSDTRFVTVGQAFADRLAPRFGAERCLSLPPSPLETYPAAMSCFDVALAPAGRTNFYQGKSDLRWLEASALGVPLVADPGVYPEIEDGVTGLLAGSPAEARAALERLVVDADLRRSIGEAAHRDVAERRSMHVAAPVWANVLAEVAALTPSLAGC
jgi:glycosyltransferase involved in cell wall biosynthesis